MARNNMFDQNVFDDSSEARKSAEQEITQDVSRGDNLFILKYLPPEERKPTTIIFSKKNYITLKKLCLDAGINMSEFVNRWVESLARS